MDGLILIDKPQYFTSHSVVIEIRKILNIKKVGHYGTLDPIATGLLVIAVGKATKLFPLFSKTDKVYKGQIRLGYSTDTYDSQGKFTSSEKKVYPSEEHLLGMMKKFEGETDQIPPLFSAKKYKGKPLYALAREKKEFELRSNKVFIHFFRLKAYNPPFISFAVKCSSGTYIRSLAHDLGQIFGCGAHLSQLTRTEVGNFNLKDGFSLEKIKRFTEKGKIDEFFIPLEVLFPEYPKIVLKEEGLALARNGNLIFPEKILKIFQQESLFSDTSEEEEIIFKLFSIEGKLLALARKIPEKNCLHPFLVIDSIKEKK